MSRLLANLSEQINSGIYKDPANDQIPLWADGKNIRFDPAGPRPVDGFSKMLFIKPSATPIRAITQAWIGTDQLVFFGNDTKLFRYNISTDTVEDVSKSGGYGSDEWFLAQWGTWILATNNSDPVQVLKPGNATFIDLPHDLGSTLTARMVFVHKSHVILIGTDSEGKEILFSDEDDAEVYDPSPSNAAGSLWVREIHSPIRGAAMHQAGLVFYGDATSHVLQWVQPPFYFGVFPLKENVGVLGPRSVIGVGTQQFGMGLDGMWAMQVGSDPQPIGRPAIHDYVYSDLDFDHKEKCVVWYDDKQRVVIFSYPSKEDNKKEPSRSVMLSLDTGGWSPLDFAATSAVRNPIFEYTSAADRHGNIFWHGRPDVGGGLPFDTQGFISLGDNFVVNNTFGKGGYGELGYGGP